MSSLMIHPFRIILLFHLWDLKAIRYENYDTSVSQCLDDDALNLSQFCPHDRPLFGPIFIF